MARKPKGSHRAYKERAPGSVKLLQQNINSYTLKINGRGIRIKLVPLAWLQSHRLTFTDLWITL